MSKRLSKDRPISRPEDDVFGLSGFADALATSLLQMSPDDGLVLSVEGPWGSGKSSAIALAVRTIQTRVLAGLGEDLDELKLIASPELDERWASRINQQNVQIVRFNPWVFSGQDNLVRAFFNELEAQLGSPAPCWWRRKRDRIASYLPAVGSSIGTGAGILAGGLPGIAAAAGVLGRALGEISQKAISNEISLEGAKRDLEKALRNSEQRLIVIIDDIDRLLPSEMRLIFSLVKSLGDLPNVLYVLAFDRSIVAKAFESGSEKLEFDFLEKIIQVSLRLPVPWRDELRGLLFTKLTEIIGEAVPGDEERWRAMFVKVVDPYLETPRDVIRLANTIQVIWPNVQGDVDLTDLVGFTVLQLFDPVVYDVIAENIEMITYAEYRYENDKAFGERLEPVKAKRPHLAKEAMALMFPRLAKVWNKPTHEGSDLAARDQRRICTSAYYRNYFQFERSPRRLSKAEVEALLSAPDPDAALGATLDRLFALDDGRHPPRVAVFLDQILETVQQRPLIRPEFVRALTKRGDELIAREDMTQDFFKRDNLDRLEAILRYGLDPLPIESRVAIMEVLVDEPSSIVLRSYTVEECAAQHGLFGRKPAHESEILFPRQMLETAVKSIVDQLAEICMSGRVLELPFPLPLRLIGRWGRMTDKATLEPWFSKVLRNRDWTLKLADGLPNRSYRSGGPKGSEVVWTFKRSIYKYLFDIDVLIARVEELSGGDKEAELVLKRLRETENA
jgi:hypothetical protein